MIQMMCLYKWQSALRWHSSLVSFQRTSGHCFLSKISFFWGGANVVVHKVWKPILFWIIQTTFTCPRWYIWAHGRNSWDGAHPYIPSNAPRDTACYCNLKFDWHHWARQGVSRGQRGRTKEIPLSLRFTKINFIYFVVEHMVESCN